MDGLQAIEHIHIGHPPVVGEDAHKAAGAVSTFDPRAGWVVEVEGPPGLSYVLSRHF